MDETTLKNVIMQSIPLSNGWHVSYAPPMRIQATDGDELTFGDDEHRDVLDQIRLAVDTERLGDMGRADQEIQNCPDGLPFYKLLLALYRKWRSFKQYTPSTTADRQFQPGADFDVNAKLNALRMSMRK